MRGKVVVSICVGLGLLTAPTVATAAIACNTAAMAGTWSFYALQIATPSIKTKNQAVLTPPNSNPGQATASVFNAVPGDQGFNNSIGHAMKCKLTIAADGHVTAPCVSYGVADPGASVSISGTLSLNSSCDLSGSLTIPGDTAATIRGGHIAKTTGTSGSGIATQGATKVMHFTIERFP